MKKPNLIAGIISILAILAGLSFLFTDWFNLNIEMSPGPGIINYNSWIGLGLLAIGIIAGYFWLKSK